MEHALYSTKDIKKTYEKVHDLLVTKHIIKSYSTNHKDIRDVALKHMDLSGVKSVLDLGCGYGFFIEKIKGLLHKKAVITGIDLVNNYEHAYLSTIASIGYSGRFIKSNVELIKSLENRSFDLIISSYSLYFFPQIIGEVCRVLKDDGMFVAVTHSKNSLHEAIRFVKSCMRKLGMESPEKTALNRLFLAFSVENGGKLLGSSFNTIEKIVYKNSLVFRLEHIDDCIYYLEKKRNLIYKEVIDQYSGRIADLEACISANIFNHAKKNGKMVLNKDDGIFICHKNGRHH